MIDPNKITWASVPLPLWLRWCGFILIAVWGVLFVWTFQTLGKNLTDTVVTRKDHELVTTGPYRYVRHPFYLSFLIAVIGGSIVTANWYLFLTSLLPFAFLVARTRIEEEKLVERFGDEYSLRWPTLRATQTITFDKVRNRAHTSPSGRLAIRLLCSGAATGNCQASRLVRFGP